MQRLQKIKLSHLNTTHLLACDVQRRFFFHSCKDLVVLNGLQSRQQAFIVIMIHTVRRAEVGFALAFDWGV